jgi:tetratricopeptide (TPR) repeat protein
MQIEDRKKSDWTKSQEQTAEDALKCKEEGNNKFKAKQHKEAEGHYREAILNLDHIKDLTEDLKKLKITCHQNMSICLNATGEYKEAIRQTSQAIKLDANASKALYLRA